MEIPDELLDAIADRIAERLALRIQEIIDRERAAVSLGDKYKASMTVRDVAKVLGIGDEATYAAVRAGEIPSIRIGRRIIVPRAALEKFLSGSR
jgi:excisionase family DNA binding protein